MIYLLAEMLLWLIAAAALGFVAAWLIRGALGSQRAAGASEATWSARMTAAEASFEAQAAADAAVVARLRADLHAATNKATAAEAASGKRLAELDAGVGVQLRAAEALAAERGVTVEQLRVALNSANTQWGNRLAAADDKASRLAAALEAAEEAAQAAAQLPTAAPAPDTSAFEAEIVALNARIAELESAAVATPAKAAKKPARPAPPPGEDDLQTIAGLGPALEKALKARGITTYRALAAVSVDEAKALGATSRSNADKWAEQARLQHEAKYGEPL